MSIEKQERIVKLITEEDNISQDELRQLLHQNKTLAQHKKELHRRKIKSYAEKGIKLKNLIKQSTDEQEKCFLNQKIKALQIKQDDEIDKLSSIDHIERQIDQYMTQKNKSVQIDMQMGDSIKKRSKSSCIINNVGVSSIDVPFHNNSNKILNFTKKQNRKMSVNNYQNQVTLREKDTNVVEQSKISKGCKDCEIFKKQRLSATNLESIQKFAIKISKELNYSLEQQSISYQFADYLISWLKSTKLQISQMNEEKEFMKNQNEQFRCQRQKLKQKKDEQQKLVKKLIKQKQSLTSSIQILAKKKEQWSKTIEGQRKIMEQIDNLETEKELLNELVNNAKAKIDQVYNEISKQNNKQDRLLSKSSSKALQINLLDEDESSISSPNQFSNFFNKFNSQLHHFLQNCSSKIREKQKKMLNLEKKVNDGSEQLEEISSKITQSDKSLKSLTNTLNETTLYLSQIEKKVYMSQKQFQNLSENIKSHVSQISELESIVALKKTLMVDLEEKYDKLKHKKKNITEKLKKIEQELIKSEQRKQNIDQKVEKQRKVLQSMKRSQQSIQKEKQEIEKSLIFKERQLQKIDKRQASVEQKFKIVKLRYEEVCFKTKNMEEIMKELKTKNEQLQQSSDNMAATVEDSERKISENQETINSQNQRIEKNYKTSDEKKREFLKVEKQMICLNEKRQKTIQKIEQQNLKMSKLKEAKTAVENEYKQIKVVKDQFQQLLQEMMGQKDTLYEQIDLKSSELSQIYNMIETLKQTHTQIISESDQRKQQVNRLDTVIESKFDEYSNLEDKIETINITIQQKIAEEDNILERIMKIKDIERKMIIEFGLKGGSGYCDEQIKKRIQDTISEVVNSQQVKNKLKQCKYQNRKLRLDNERINKLLNQQLEEPSLLL